VTRSLSIAPGVWSNYNTDPRAETTRPGGLVMGVFFDDPTRDLQGHWSLTWNLGKIEEQTLSDRWLNRNSHQCPPFGLKSLSRALSGNSIIVSTTVFSNENLRSVGGSHHEQPDDRPGTLRTCAALNGPGSHDRHFGPAARSGPRAVYRRFSPGTAQWLSTVVHGEDGADRRGLQKERHDRRGPRRLGRAGAASHVG